MTQQHKRQSETKMVPVPSQSIVPERDVDKRPVLETRHLGVDFGGLKAVEDFNLTIGRTEIAGLIGPNGAGKSTTLNTIAGLLKPRSGSITFEGRNLLGMKAHKLVSQGMALCPEGRRIFQPVSYTHLTLPTILRV